MRRTPFQYLLVTSAILILAGCGSDSGDSRASDSEDAAAPVRQAEGGAKVLKISPRTYVGGSVQVKVSGFFEVDGSQSLNKPASITDDDHTWIQYGVSGAPELNVLFTNSQSMAESGVTIGVGPYTVTAANTSGECRTNFDVGPTTMSGHFSCTGSTGYNKSTGQMGKVDIEVKFNVNS